MQVETLDFKSFFVICDTYYITVNQLQAMVATV